jgi:hypothetical protein
MSRRFQRRIEDFSCERCGRAVTGSGYTNHCPACLWSKHVDVNPGDRAAECGGAMEPVGVVSKHGAWRIQHRCTVCGAERICTASAEDSTEALAALLRGPGTGK